MEKTILVKKAIDQTGGTAALEEFDGSFFLQINNVNTGYNVTERIPAKNIKAAMKKYLDFIHSVS